MLPACISPSPACIPLRPASFSCCLPLPVSPVSHPRPPPFPFHLIHPSFPLPVTYLRPTSPYSRHPPIPLPPIVYFPRLPPSLLCLPDSLHCLPPFPHPCLPSYRYITAPTASPFLLYFQNAPVSFPLVHPPYPCPRWRLSPYLRLQVFLIADASPTACLRSPVYIPP